MTRDAVVSATSDSAGQGPSLAGRAFFKMTGSGNDFVFFDNTGGGHDDLVSPATIGAICDRRRGIGADGIVLIDRDPDFAFGMRYYNRDGSLAEMCGNATLCSARLATTLGIVGAGDFTFRTSSGPVTARLVDGVPEIDITPVTDLAVDASGIARVAGERRIGFARVGVPHLVVLVDHLDGVQVEERGRQLRYHPTLRDGANANFVGQRTDGTWAMRTYERGVEAETLACGTGTVAAVALLNAWGLASSGIAMATTCGVPLFADVPRERQAPVLRGEGRIVARGIIIDLPGW